jgi:predicted RecB family nuclease
MMEEKQGSDLLALKLEELEKRVESLAQDQSVVVGLMNALGKSVAGMRLEIRQVPEGRQIRWVRPGDGRIVMPS